MRASLALVLVAGVACGGTTQSPVGSEPAGDDLQSNLVARGVTVDRISVGDAGCSNMGYDDQALRMDVRLGDADKTYSVYVIKWPDIRSFNDDYATDPPDGAHPPQPFRDCVNRYVGTHIRPVVVVGSFPWRAYGPELPEDLRQIFLDSMHAAGGL